MNPNSQSAAFGSFASPASTPFGAPVGGSTNQVIFRNPASPDPSGLEIAFALGFAIGVLAGMNASADELDFFKQLQRQSLEREKLEIEAANAKTMAIQAKTMAIQAETIFIQAKSEAKKDEALTKIINRLLKKKRRYSSSSDNSDSSVSNSSSNNTDDKANKKRKC